MAFNPVGAPMPRLALLRALPRIRGAIRATEPDAIVAFMHSAFVPIGFATLGTGIPMVASEHTEARHYGTRSLQRYLRRIVDRWSVLRTVPSENTRRGFLAIDQRESIVVPNPILLPDSKSRIEPIPTNRKIILSVGYMRPEKDQATLIDAFALVASDFEDWTLRIVGDGWLRPELEGQVEKLGLKHRIEMPGTSQDMASVYAAAEFLALPSRYESFGMAAVEALAMGRGVLAFDDCGGTSEIIENNVNGLLVRGMTDRPTRVASMAEGLRRMMIDPNLRQNMGQAGPASVEQFQLDAVLDRWEEILGDFANPVYKKLTDR